MAEALQPFKRPTKTKGFYVRMKMLNHKNQEKKNNNNISNPFYKYYKWVLWFTVSLYFLASFSLTHKPIPLPTKTHSSKSSALHSRALLEPLNDPLNGLKIFVYDLPSHFDSEWLSNDRCSTHLFASEVAIHKALLNDAMFRTFDPYEADFFFVPVYVSCNFSTVNGFPAIGHARSFLSSAVDLVSSTYPFWNRSRGSDHVFVASHDYGACFHAMEERAKEDGIPEFLKNSIILQTFGVNYDHPCQEVENVVIPPYVSPESVERTLERASDKGQKRDIWVFFRGKMEVHPKNISGRFYSKKVRTVIWRRFSGDRRFYLQRHRFPGYQSEIVRSVFCLCPLGWAPWSPRLVESVALGCVPVVIADGIRLPFPEAVPWPEISLTVAERDVAELGTILEHVAATNLSDIQRNLWDPGVRRALMFNSDGVQKGDATWQVLHALSGKLDRSYNRRSGVSDQ